MSAIENTSSFKQQLKEMNYGDKQNIGVKKKKRRSRSISSTMKVRCCVGRHNFSFSISVSLTCYFALNTGTENVQVVILSYNFQFPKKLIVPETHTNKYEGLKERIPLFLSFRHNPGFIKDMYICTYVHMYMASNNFSFRITSNI